MMTQWVTIDKSNKPFDSNLSHHQYGQGLRRGGARGSKRPSCLFLRGQGGQKCPFLTVFILILATVFQPENTIESTSCLKLTEIHLITLLLYQYKAST